MMTRHAAGTATRLLCLPLALTLLATSDRPLSPPWSVVVDNSNIDEIRDVVSDTKRHLLLQQALNEAAPPIHVDPYPHSKGMTHHMSGRGALK
jgi:hypothetical protein